MDASSLLKNARAAPFGVGERREALIYSRVNCAFSPFSTLPRIRRSASQKTARYPMKTASVIFSLAGVLLGNAAHAGFSRWPEVSPPPLGMLQWVADDIVQNGVPMKIRSLSSAASVDEVMAHYRAEWSAVGDHAPIENAVGQWRVLGQQRGDYYITLQIMDANASGSEGFVALSRVGTLLKQGPRNDSQFPRLGGTTVISTTDSHDAGKNARTLIMTNHFSVDANLSFYRGTMKSAGWTLQNNFTDNKRGTKAQVLYFQRARESCHLAVSDSGSGVSVIAVNVQRETRSDSRW
jgi:hypothetical protein